MRSCEACGKSAGTTHHYYSRDYLKKLGLGKKSSLWRYFRGKAFQHNFCNHCHQDMNTTQSRCKKECEACKYSRWCCYTHYLDLG